MSEPLTFTSFADFKRKIKPGMTFQVDNIVRPAANGQRQIRAVQTNAITACCDGQTEPTWCYFPKSTKQIRIDGSRVSFLADDGSVLWHYYDFREAL